MPRDATLIAVAATAHVCRYAAPIFDAITPCHSMRLPRELLPSVSFAIATLLLFVV